MIEDIEERLGTMRDSVLRGRHFADAAREAGIPYDVALAEASRRAEMRQWLIESKNRPVVVTEAIEPIHHGDLSPEEMKARSLTMLWNAGLWHKMAEMVLMSDTATEDGREIILRVLQNYARDMLPKEFASRRDRGQKPEIAESIDAMEEKGAALLEKYQRLLDAKKRSKETMHRLAIEHAEGENSGSAAS